MLSVNSKNYTLLALGGTFDHFHIGHEKFIKFASGLSRHIIIGLTNQEMAVTKQLPNSIQTYEQRKEVIEKFCHDSKIHFEILTLQNIFGTTLTNTDIEGLAVTTETKQGANVINQKRQELNLEPLPVHICQLVNDELGQPIHSARIRAGKINREGKVLELAIKNGVVLTSAQHSKLKQFRAEIVTEIAHDDEQLVAVVGDATLSRFLQENKKFHLAIYDNKTKRKPVQTKAVPNYTVKNHAGEISSGLVTTLKSSISAGGTIFVDGEEDLATVALTLLLPLGSVIYYGQPDEGLMKLTVTTQVKEYLYNFLN